MPEPRFRLAIRMPESQHQQWEAEYAQTFPQHQQSRNAWWLHRQRMYPKLLEALEAVANEPINDLEAAEALGRARAVLKEAQNG